MVFPPFIVSACRMSHEGSSKTFNKFQEKCDGAGVSDSSLPRDSIFLQTRTRFKRVVRIESDINHTHSYFNATVGSTSDAFLAGK